MLQALESALTIVTVACKQVGISRTTHYEWMKTDPDYYQAVMDLEDVVLDFAESKLHALVQNGDTASTIFLLKTKGKRRGYIERAELELSKGINIEWQETRTYDSNPEANSST